MTCLLLRKNLFNSIALRLHQEDFSPNLKTAFPFSASSSILVCLDIYFTALLFLPIQGCITSFGGFESTINSICCKRSAACIRFINSSPVTIFTACC